MRPKDLTHQSSISPRRNRRCSSNRSSLTVKLMPCRGGRFPQLATKLARGYFVGFEPAATCTKTIAGFAPGFQIVLCSAGSFWVVMVFSPARLLHCNPVSGVCPEKARCGLLRFMGKQLLQLVWRELFAICLDYSREARARPPVNFSVRDHPVGYLDGRNWVHRSP